MMKTEKRKANVGERILITNPMVTGGYYVLNSVLSVIKSLDNVVVTEDNPRWVSHEEYEVIVSELKPKKSARISALETQVAALEAKVEALESAGKYPLTERFERESAVESEAVDGILADIERKAKPTLDALLATYPAPNQQRADVIKRAKAFVADLEERMKSMGKNTGGNYTFSDRLTVAEFHVNAEKRTVVALVRGFYNSELLERGIAKCDPDDVFNADIGKAIALARALGVDVPTEFVKALQPTEVVVGMVVRGRNTGNAYKATEVYGKGILHKEDENGKLFFESIASFTDDTDAVYE